ncbi:uncharacterized protein FA14DRAFT_183024 [Meira miltonrushii]|uniref:Uncharacterized protein n=1 Tax=Meira miltonrushii TaxID=1280837 RepID=A0A316VJH5_9BASI|nr:uncharacterized protein FA14DRAFT_183024 [Meira miltonrushii]PWN36453.1 hypothetical protein FA14DRAFT_183024 [Meira miltonrushii]
MPRLPDDVRSYLLSEKNQKDSFTYTFRVWKMHSSIWIRNALINQIEREGIERESEENIDAKSLQLIKMMETDESAIEGSTQLLRTNLFLSEIGNNLHDFIAGRMYHAKLAARYSSYILRNMIASRSLQSKKINANLSSVALNAVYGLVNDLPKIIALQRSHYQFPAVNHFTGKMFETAMQTTLSTINRLDVVQNEPRLVEQVCSLLYIIPKSCTLMNQCGLTGPFGFALQSTFTPVSVKRPIKMINDGLYSDTNFLNDSLTLSDRRTHEKNLQLQN